MRGTRNIAAHELYTHCTGGLISFLGQRLPGLPDKSTNTSAIIQHRSVSFYFSAKSKNPSSEEPLHFEKISGKSL